MPLDNLERMRVSAFGFIARRWATVVLLLWLFKQMRMVFFQPFSYGFRQFGVI